MTTPQIDIGITREIRDTITEAMPVAAEQVWESADGFERAEQNKHSSALQPK